MDHNASTSQLACVVFAWLYFPLLLVERDFRSQLFIPRYFLHHVSLLFSIVDHCLGNLIKVWQTYAYLGLRNLRELQMSSCKVSDAGISHLKGRQLDWVAHICVMYFIYLSVYLGAHYLAWFLFGPSILICKLYYNTGLKKLVHLNLEGCPVTGASLEFISGPYHILFNCLTSPPPSQIYCYIAELVSTC